MHEGSYGAVGEFHVDAISTNIGYTTNTVASVLDQVVFVVRLGHLEPPRRFEVTETYDKDDLIENGRYGIGRVTDVRGDRIDVKFTDGAVRTFMHGKR